MCSEYIAAGLPPERFWEITPRLFWLETDGARKRLEREQRDRIEAAWFTESFARLKKLPPLDRVLAGKKARKTAEEIRDDFRAMASQLPKISLEQYLERKRKNG